MHQRSTAFIAALVLSTSAVLLARPLPAAPVGDGHADLQGVWSFSTITPLERPAEFTGREFLTEAEARAYEQRVAERSNRDNRESSPEADVSGAYNEFWWDRGVHAARVHGKVRTSLIVDPPDGKLPPLTAEGQARAAARAQARQAHPADGPEDRSLGERCLLFNAGPPMLSGPYNNYMQIVQTRDHLVIHNEMIHDARVVPLDGRPHLPSSVRVMLGDSRGRWEGATLVVETTNFTDKTTVRGSGPGLRLTERFTLDGPSTLLYQFTVDDPASFTKPWTAVLPMTRTDAQLYEYACHEGNYAMTGILRGARAGER